ncbi:MAG: permease prefix domain 2-containing transporter, partial [Acidobacteriota bacterium]
MKTAPPSWADALLRLFVGAEHVESVSGDLLEEYRDSVVPRSGQRRADRWYVLQVLGFVWRSTGLWACLFGGAFVVRTALDWLAPPVTFGSRSTVSTLLGVTILLVAAARMGWRSGSFLTGSIAGLTIAALGAVVSIGGDAALLAFWHDPATMSAIRNSGGLDEVFILPIL